ncbi:MAG: serine/threonine protein kinase [Myxococcaceae bacterium]
MAVAFGSYQLVRRLARSGMGQVFLARDPAKQRLVVIKRLSPELTRTAAFVKMFSTEAKLVQRLDHPRIVHLYEQGEASGHPYLVLEYIAGADLKALLGRAAEMNRPLGFPAICRVVADAAAGLDAAHHATGKDGEPLGLVHRDVSPANLLVGFDGATRITDFGIAKVLDDEGTESGIVKGKYPYMSPEQADFKKLDHRSDVFSLGIVLWELLTRRRLFKGDTDLQSLQLVRDCQVPSPSKLQPAIPAGVEKVAMRALSKEPRKRFSDAGAMAEALEELARSEGLRITRADLGTTVRALFPDRSVLSYDAAGLDELPPELSLDAESAPPAPVVVEPDASLKPTPPRRYAHVRKPNEGPGVTEAVDDNSRRPLWIALTALALVAIAWVVGSRYRGASHSEHPTAAGVTVLLTSEPSGAEVRLDDVRIGRTPLEYAVGSDAPPVSVQFSLEGYVTKQVDVSGKNAPRLKVRLPRPPR